MANEYYSLDEYKDLAKIKDSRDDVALESILEGVSRFIDAECWTRFFSVTETRYYTADDARKIEVFDITVIDALATDSAADRTYASSWANTDYDPVPFNASLDGEPYTSIEVAPNGDFAFPVGLAKGVKLTGDFGYVAENADPPAGIVQATILGTNRVLARHKTPLGVAAGAALGEMKIVVSQLKSDPDFQEMISYFQRKA